MSAILLRWHRPFAQTVAVISIFLCGFVALGQGDQADAEELAQVLQIQGIAEMAKGNVEAGIVTLKQALTANPFDRRTHAYMAWGYHQLGDENAALSEFRLAFEFGVSAPEPIPEIFADPDLFLQRGIALRESGHSDFALADFDRALQLDPENASTHLNRAWVYTLLGDYESALEDLNQAVAHGHGHFYHSDEYPFAQYYRGFVHSMLGDSHAAANDFMAAYAMDHERFADPWRIREMKTIDSGDVERVSADHAAGLALYESLQPSDPFTAEERWNLVRGLEGTILPRSDDEIQNLIEEATQAIEAGSEDELAYWQRAQANFLAGDYAAVEQDLRGQFRQRGDRAAYHFLFGLANLGVGNYEIASAAFGTAGQLGMHGPELSYYAGLSAERLHWYALALQTLTRAVDLDPTHPQYNQLRDAVEARIHIRPDMRLIEPDGLGIWDAIFRYPPEWNVVMHDTGGRWVSVENGATRVHLYTPTFLEFQYMLQPDMRAKDLLKNWLAPDDVKLMDQNLIEADINGRDILYAEYEMDEGERGRYRIVIAAPFDEGTYGLVQVFSAVPFEEESRQAIFSITGSFGAD